MCAFSVWFLSSFFNVKFSPQSWQPEKWFGEASRQKSQAWGGCYDATFQFQFKSNFKKHQEFVTNFTVFMIDSLGLDASSYHFCYAILSHKHGNFLTICLQDLHASLNHCFSITDVAIVFFEPLNHLKEQSKVVWRSIKAETSNMRRLRYLWL